MKTKPMTTLFINIKELIQVRELDVMKVCGKNMGILPIIKNAFLIIKDDVIIDFGSMNTLGIKKSDKVIDLTGKLVLPTWCDSHTHLVFADTREEEFVNRIKGLTYQEIAEKGGGILNSSIRSGRSLLMNQGVYSEKCSLDSVTKKPSRLSIS